jgi:hypothetical protein
LEEMGKLFSRILITGVALAVILIRTFRPDIKVDSTSLILLGVAISPWLSKVVKGVEVPGGLKLEYRDEEDRPIVAPAHPASRQQSAAPEAIAQKYPTGDFADSYISRLVKLTPVEPIALFLIVSSIVLSTPTRAAAIVEWSIFGFLLLMTPLFFRKVGAQWPQAVAMMLSFCAWIFAIGGPFSMLRWYQPWYGGLVLALFMSALPLLRFD